jgi:fucose permease
VLACVLFLGRAEDEIATREFAPPALTRGTLALVLAFALLLLVYEGLEAGVGTWEATDLLSSGSSTQFAAAATSLFWGAFTVGRALTAPLAVRWSPQRILVPAFILGTLLSLGIRAHVAPPLLFAMVGLCAAPIFPVAVSWMTRVIPNAMTLTTYAILGAVIGSALVPAGLGALIGVAGTSALPLGVAACALASLGMVGVITLRLRT